jgi:hypothetical protein
MDALTANLQRELEIMKAYPTKRPEDMLTEMIEANGVSPVLCGVQATKMVYDCTYTMAIRFDYADWKRRQEDAEEQRNRDAQRHIDHYEAQEHSRIF